MALFDKPESTGDTEEIILDEEELEALLNGSSVQNVTTEPEPEPEI